MRLTALALVVLLGQATFEVASVKPAAASAQGGGTDMTGVRFRASNMTPQELIRAAYGEPGRWLPSSQIVGGPGWLRTSRFDIQASAGDVAPNVKLQMLRALLEERFSLRLHHESRDGDIYALVAARPGRLGPQLRSVSDDCGNQPCTFRLGLGPTIALVMRGQAIAQLANGFARLLNRTVVDKTDLTGAFDADMTFSANGLDGLAATSGTYRPDSGSDEPSIFTAVQEQLGLKLEPAKGPVDVLVIDHIQPPTPD